MKISCNRLTWIQGERVDMQHTLVDFEGMASIEKPKSPAKSVAGNRIDVRKAVTIALNFFHDLFPEAAGANLMLEEFEQSENGAYWLITLGYDVRSKSFVPGMMRAYKTFKVDGRTGKVTSVKIRNI